MNVCDLDFQGQPLRSHIFFNIFDILDLKNVRIDTAPTGRNLKLLFGKQKRQNFAQTTSFPLNSSVKSQIRNYLEESSPSQKETGMTIRIMF